MNSKFLSESLIVQRKLLQDERLMFKSEFRSIKIKVLFYAFYLYKIHQLNSRFFLFSKLSIWEC